MQSTTMTAIVSLLAAGLLAPASVEAQDRGAPRGGDIHLIKSCPNYTGTAGAFCTITSSDFAGIPVNSTFNYAEAPYAAQSGAFPGGLLDSTVVAYAGPGNWATGRCTLDLKNASGLCTFTDGVGTLAGFHARLNVALTTSPNWSLIGTYHFAEAGE
jgi:hypothetical protein